MPTQEQLWMAVQLAADDVLFFGRHGFFIKEGVRLENDDILPYVLCNDVFAPAADCEEVSWEQIGEVFEMYRDGGEDAILKWIAKRRGHPVESIYGWKKGSS